MIHAISPVVALVLNATANLIIKAGAKAIQQEHAGEVALPLVGALKAAVVSPWIIGAKMSPKKGTHH